MPGWVNGAPGEQLSVRDRGLAYGDGLFETIAVRGGRIPLLARHLARLAEGCRRLAIPLDLALMDSELLVIRFRDFEALFDRHACWERVGRKIAEGMFISKERRERELLMLSAEERYRLFLGRYKHLEKRIPQYQIAAYLGITPVALSRIRRRLT